MTVVGDKRFFPTVTVVGGDSFREALVFFQDNFLYVFHRKGKDIVSVVDGVEIVSVSSRRDSSLSDVEYEKRSRLRKVADETVVELVDGVEVVVRVLTSCGCGNPLKRLKSVASVRSAVESEASKYRRVEARGRRVDERRPKRLE